MVPDLILPDTIYTMKQRKLMNELFHGSNLCEFYSNRYHLIKLESVNLILKEGI